MSSWYLAKKKRTPIPASIPMFWSMNANRDFFMEILDILSVVSFSSGIMSVRAMYRNMPPAMAKMYWLAKSSSPKRIPMTKPM